MPGSDSYTKLLLHCDGSDGSTTFTDSSASAHTVTANGDAQVDTAQSVFGGASALFDGTGDYLSVPDSDEFYLSGDFTLDFRLRFNSSIPSGGGLCGQRVASTDFWAFDFVGSTLQFQVFESSSFKFNASCSWFPSADTWYHIAIVRSSNVFKIYVDGTYITTSTSTDTIPNVAAALTIGWTPGNGYLNGWIDEFRFSNGISRWTANFTPPTAAYDDSPETESARLPARANAVFPITATLSARADAVGLTNAQLPARADALRYSIEAKLPARADAILGVRGFLAARSDSRAETNAKLGIRADALWYVGSLLGARAGSIRRLSTKLASRSNAYVPDGWDLYAKDIATGTVTRLGWISKDSDPLTLTEAMADGTYDIEARPWGWYWKDTRTTSVKRITITGGAPVSATLPPIRDLRALELSAWGRDILFTWDDAYDIETPADFALWFADASPVTTSGTPDAVLYARHAGATHLYRYAQSATKVVAVAARDGDAVVGPVSELALAYPSASVTSPDAQWATEGS